LISEAGWNSNAHHYCSATRGAADWSTFMPRLAAM
jgi:hypothetical protein